MFSRHSNIAHIQTSVEKLKKCQVNLDAKINAERSIISIVKEPLLIKRNIFILQLVKGICGPSTFNEN